MALPGNVVTIRVNPRDTMSVIDLVESLGIPLHTLSFPAMASLALSSCLEALRQQGVVPDRDGFEYSERTAGIIGTGQNKKKRAATLAILQTGSELKIAAPPVPSPMFVKAASQIGTAAPRAGHTNGSDDEVISLEVRQARTRLAELNAKKELYDDGHPGITWSAGDQKEFDELMVVVYG